MIINEKQLHKCSCGTLIPFEKKDILKNRNYSARLNIQGLEEYMPKCEYTTIEVPEIKRWELLLR